MIQAVEATTGAPPGVAVADKGYLTEHNLATLRGQGQRCLIGAGGGGRSKRPIHRRRIEAGRVPPPPRTAVSGHAPSRRLLHLPRRWTCPPRRADTRACRRA